MPITKTIIRLAEEQAVAGFSALADHIIGEADASINQAAMGASGDPRLYSGARGFLHDQGRQFELRLCDAYNGYLARAMQTMHKDLRTGYRDISADTLTLIEDDVVTRQIEVDRLVQRLRDADPVNLARLNLVIAQMHGDPSVRERENPFRPYLLARALHEALREMVPDEARAKLLFEHLSTALANQLPNYYGSIHDVFESRGVHARLQPRVSDMSRAERDRLAWKRAAEQMLGRTDTAAAPADVQSRMLPKLQGLASYGQTQGQAEDLQQLVWNVFNQPKIGRQPDAAQQAGAARSAIDAQLMQLQQAAAAAPAAGTAMPSPLDMREQIVATAGDHDAVTVDLVALLFEFIVNDDRMPEGVRKELGRMLMPFLRAALAQPTMLHDAQHPARRLLDRIGTIGINIEENTEAGAAVASEISRTVSSVVAGFDDDVAVFSQGELALDSFVAARERDGDEDAVRCADVLDAVESSAARSDASAHVLRDLLGPLEADARLVVFLVDTWSLVLAAPGASDAHLDLVPELVWSAQEKTAPEDRTALMRMLPGLVPRVRAGLALIGFPELAAKQALDQLVDVHMDVLGNRLPPSTTRRMNLEALRTHFSTFAHKRDAVIAAMPKNEAMTRAEIEAALAGARIPAIIHAEPEHIVARPSHTAWLAWARPGAGFEFMVEEKYVPIRLCAVTQRESAYVFLLEGESHPIIYTQAALLTSMHAAKLRTVEYAPLFDRAVESLMVGAQSLAQSS